MWRHKSFLISLFLGAILLVAALAYHHWNNLEWIQRTSGVRLPRGIRDVSVYDDGEMYVTAHVRLPMSAINDFVTSLHFEPAANASSKLLGMDNLTEAFRRFPQNADLVAYSGRTTQNMWHFVLDKHSGHLWVTVQYPDYQGDSP